MGQNTRAAGAFKTQIGTDATGRVTLSWEKVEAWQDWARLSEGCYLLRSNLKDWSAEDLWQAYIQLTEAEGTFRIHKSDLALRPVWHQKQERVEAHILVCFIAYAMWKTLLGWMNASGLGDAPRTLLEEMRTIQSGEVMLPLRNAEGAAGETLVIRCVTQPDQYTKVLLGRLGVMLPNHLKRYRLAVAASTMACAM